MFGYFWLSQTATDTPTMTATCSDGYAVCFPNSAIPCAWGGYDVWLYNAAHFKDPHWNPEMLFASINMPSCFAPWAGQNTSPFWGSSFSHQCNGMATVYISICGPAEILWDIITQEYWDVGNEFPLFYTLAYELTRLRAGKKCIYKNIKKATSSQKEIHIFWEIHRIYNKMHLMSYSRWIPILERIYSNPQHPGHSYNSWHVFKTLRYHSNIARLYF